MDLIIPVVVLVALTVLATVLFKLLFFPKNSSFSSRDKMTDVEKMLVLKYPEVDVHKNRRFTLITGLFVTMVFTAVLVERTTRKLEEEVKEKATAESLADEVVAPPPTKLPPPPPPKAKPPTPKLVEAIIDLPEDTTQVVVEPKDEDQGFNFDEEEEEGEEEEEEEEEEAIDMGIYEDVSVTAVPPNGNSFMFMDEYIVPRINGAAIQPDLEAGLQGFFEVQFVVEMDGSVSNVVVLTPVGPNIDAEVVRILSSSRWTPAQRQGAVCRQRLLLDTYFEY